MSKEKTPHVHAQWIKAKADGETIQEQAAMSTRWVDMDVDDWSFASTRKYRIKPSAPETRMTGPELEKVWDSEPGNYVRAFRAIANAAIARALADGDVVLP